MKSINLQKNPLRELGESADKLRVRVLAYNDVSAVIISSMLYKGDFDGAYKKCIERFGETDTLTHWAYDLSLQWKIFIEIFMRNREGE